MPPTSKLDAIPSPPSAMLQAAPATLTVIRPMGTSREPYIGLPHAVPAARGNRTRKACLGSKALWALSGFGVELYRVAA